MFATVLETSWGLSAKSEVARIRKENESRTSPWTMDDLLASVPQSIGNRKQWKLTASDGAGDLQNACGRQSE